MLNDRQTVRKRPARLLPKLILGLGIVGVLVYMGREFFFASRYKGADVLVLGHGGAGFVSPLNPYNPLPANSRASIKKALEVHGADGLELDVQLTKDGVLVLYHDGTLMATTGRQDTIQNLNAAQVVGLRYQEGLLYDLFQREKVITLREALELFSTYAELPYLHIDLRNYDTSRYSEYAKTVLRLLQEYEYPLAKLAFISPDPEFLKAFKVEEPAATLLLDATGSFEETQQQVLAYGLSGICVNGRDVTKEQVQAAKQQGLQVVLFGGKSNSRIAKMIEMEPNAIQVNDVAAMRRMVD